MKTPKQAVHLTVPRQLWAAFSALASLQGRAASEMAEELIRKELASLGLLKPPTPEELEAAMAEKQNAKTKRAASPKPPKKLTSLHSHQKTALPK